MISTKLNIVNSISNEQLDTFYNVMLDKHDLSLQGDICDGTLKTCKELGIELTWDNDYKALRGANEENSIKICLTIK
jgi:hypothetical protein